MHFREIYPYKPPKCKFPQGFFHPNVYPSGKVYLPSILNDDIFCKFVYRLQDDSYGYCVFITLFRGGVLPVKQILVGIQYLLDQPNLNNPAQIEGYNIYIQDNVEYKRQ
ncbi:hypothetical protein KY289_030667 [Solanum tuberosum]|nr:hypothetical protein KY289_030667 [Solanum tuberosum]